MIGRLICKPNRLPPFLVHLRPCNYGAVPQLNHSFMWRQVEFLRGRPFCPNQLKWKQLVNSLIGSRKSDSRLIDSMDLGEVLKILEFVSLAHCQSRRHELFSCITRRLSRLVSENDSASSGDILSMIQLYLNASLDVIDANSRRYKTVQIRECVTATHTLMNELFSVISKRQLLIAEIPKFLFVASIAASKDWSDPIGFSLSEASNKAIGFLLGTDANHSIRIETIWAISRLVKLGLVEQACLDIVPLRRLISPNELQRYELGNNFTCLEVAPVNSFHHLLQLEEAFTTLDLRETSVGKLLGTIMESITPTNSLIMVDFIWWCAMAECDVHPRLSEWAKAGTGGLSENDRWKFVNGISHIVEISKRRGTVSSDKLEQLEYFIRNNRIS
jgi:hypothetical protein